VAVFAAKLQKEISGRFSVEADDRVVPAAGTDVGAGDGPELNDRQFGVRFMVRSPAPRETSKPTAGWFVH
jgi:hypothetical protein